MTRSEEFDSFAKGLSGHAVFNRENPHIPDLTGASAAQLRHMAACITSDKDAADVIAFLMETIQTLQEQQKELEQDAFKDSLTGLYNRRACNMILDHEIKRGSRDQGYKGPSVLYADLSLFKSINDTYGHAAGDAALKFIASVLVKSCRAGDVVARVGGDEMAVILPNCNKNDAKQTRLRIMRAVQTQHFVYEDHTLQVGINIGFAEYKVGETVESLIHRSDRLMQRIKEMDPARKGRGRHTVDAFSAPGL